MAPVKQLALLLSPTLVLRNAQAAKPNLGLASPSAMVCSVDTPARVFVGTSLGEIAAIKMDGGYSQWQNKDHQDRSGIKTLKAHGKMLLGVSEGGTVHALDAHSGATLWEHKYDDKVVDIFPSGPEDGSSTIVLHEGGVQARTPAGEHEWGVAPAVLGKPQASFVAAALAADGSVLCAVANDTDAGSGLLSVKIDTSSGKVTQREEVPAPVAEAISDFVVVGEHLAYVQGETLSVYPICGSGVADTFDLSPYRSKPHRKKHRVLPWLHTPGVFAVTQTKQTLVFRIGNDGLKHLRTEDGVGVVGPIQSPVSGYEQTDHVIIAVKRGSAYDVKFYNVLSELTERERVIQDHDAEKHGAPWYGSVCGYKQDIQINLLTEDHTIASIKGARPAWTLGVGHKDVKRRSLDPPGVNFGHFDHENIEL